MNVLGLKHLDHLQKKVMQSYDSYVVAEVNSEAEGRASVIYQHYFEKFRSVFEHTFHLQRMPRASYLEIQFDEHDPRTSIGLFANSITIRTPHAIKLYTESGLEDVHTNYFDELQFSYMGLRMCNINPDTKQVPEMGLALYGCTTENYTSNEPELVIISSPLEITSIVRHSYQCN